MGYRQQLMEMLGALNERIRSAAVTGREKFLDFDQAYADRLHNAIYPPDANNPIMGAISGHISTPLRNSLPNMIYDGNETFAQKMMGEAYRYTAPVTNATARYLLPAAGVTAAGKGLYDLTQMLSPYKEDEED